MPIPAQFRESVSETTALLTPSGCSTEQSSRENLIGLLDEEETLKLTRNGSEIQLQSFGHLAGDDDYYDDLGKRKRRRFPGLFCVAGVVVLSALVVVLCKRSSTSESLPTRFQARRPLSTLDPVKDLGLAAFRRPEESSPPKTLTKILSAEAPSTQFPTNAWYQNLLLVEDEPTQANRAYSIPYVIDATGPIPGLRVLPNHVGATQDVVQIYVVEEYGLTLGASIDEKEKEPSKRYNVVKTTDLGLTVQWVSKLCGR